MIARVSLALAASALLAGAAGAHPNEVTVHRGADTHKVSIDAQGHAIAANSKAIYLERGSVAVDADIDRGLALARSMGGRTLWIVDEAGDKLIACRLHKTFRVGDRDIRCESEDLSRALREADERR